MLTSPCSSTTSTLTVIRGLFFCIGVIFRKRWGNGLEVLFSRPGGDNSSLLRKVLIDRNAVDQTAVIPDGDLLMACPFAVLSGQFIENQSLTFTAAISVTCFERAVSTGHFAAFAASVSLSLSTVSIWFFTADIAFDSVVWHGFKNAGESVEKCYLCALRETAGNQPSPE